MESGARAAIAGYRKQALYTLDLLLAEAGAARVFQPEGKEDLAVYQDEALIHVAQVKAYTDPLTLSDLRPNKQGSFLKRVLEVEDGVAVQLVSFGPLGPELDGFAQGKATDLERVSSKLVRHGFSSEEVEALVHRLRIVRADEEETQVRVTAALQRTLTSGEPNRAMELLTWWLLRAAERRQKVTNRGLQKKLEEIGRYFSERAAHHAEWFTSIRPLSGTPDSSGGTEQRLAEEYYRGSAARYSHIVAGLDVRRERLLSHIEANFDAGRRVLILHGASGQGKTSLALRYLHDAVPDDWRFMVTAIEDRRHAARMALAIADHLHTFDAHAYLFIDVAPRDLDWVTLVKELLDAENVRLLVAIREEDLARRTAPESELGFPADLSMEFDELEAEEVYDQLVERGDATNAFPTFREAWERFGGRGPLLEFVYLVTQTDSLRSVLASQVRRLRDEVQAQQLEPGAIRLLQACATVTWFEARVAVQPLCEHLEIRDPTRLIQLFEHEYLLRLSEEKGYLEALHPVRSHLLSEILDDPSLTSSSKLAIETMQFVPDSDIEVFLLYLLSRWPEEYDSVQDCLCQLELTTWKGAAGIARALLWWGVRAYLEESHSVLKEAERIGGDSWPTLLIGDLAGAGESDLTESLLGLLETQNERAAVQLRSIRERLGPPLTAFEPLRRWLVTLALESRPGDVLDWEGYAEVIFWRGRLGLPASGTITVADAPVEHLPTGVTSRLVLALSESAPELHASFVETCLEKALHQFRSEMRVVLLTNDDNTASAHFVVPFDQIRESDEMGAPEATRSAPASTDTGAGPGDSLDHRLNAEAVRRAEVLRGLLPGKLEYCTQGLGHQLDYPGGVKLPHDSTHKRMPPSALPMPWLVRVNGMTSNLWAYQNRPPTWAAYARLLLAMREDIATAFLKLDRALTSYFKGNQPRSILGGTLTEDLWGRAKRAAATAPLMPTTAVDQWGLSSETQGRRTGKPNGFSVNIASGLSLRRHRSFSGAVRDFASAAANFFNAAEVILHVHGFTGRSPQTVQLSDAAAKLGYTEDLVRLSLQNLFEVMLKTGPMSRAFAERVGSLVDAQHLGRVTKREEHLFPTLWALWFQFCRNPRARMSDAGARSHSAMENARGGLRKRLDAGLETLERGTARPLTERFEWDGRPVLALGFELSSLIELDEARTELFETLGASLGGLGAGSLDRYALEYFWPQIVVVPFIKGKALDMGAWIVPAFVIPVEDGTARVERPWLRILQPLTEDQMHSMGFDVTHLQGEGDFKDLHTEVAGLQLLYAYLGSFETVVPDLDETGREVLAEYFSALSPKLGKQADKVHHLLRRSIARVEHSKVARSQITEVLVQPLIGQLEELDSLGDNVQLNISDCVERAAHFGELAGNAALLRWLISLGGDASLLGLDPSDLAGGA